MENQIPKKEQFQQIVQQGFQLLNQELVYKQVDVLKKLQTIDREISSSSLSNILKGKKTGGEILKKAAEGIREIVRSELGHCFDLEKGQYLPIPPTENWEPFIITPFDPERPDQNKQLRYLAEGRPSIQEKVAFLESAQSEIVEMGLRLRTFTDYFFSRNEHEFALPIKRLMKRGVKLKLYLLDPESNNARLYFDDRSLAPGHEQEKESPEVIQKVLANLKNLRRSLEAEDLADQLEVYTYRHIPYNHFLIVDGKTRAGKMMVSHYMYGVKRADCPVVEFSKQTNHDLYRKYWKSYQDLILHAKAIDFGE
jgi:hypothetical protein